MLGPRGSRQERSSRHHAAWQRRHAGTDHCIELAADCKDRRFTRERPEEPQAHAANVGSPHGGEIRRVDRGEPVGIGSDDDVCPPHSRGSGLTFWRRRFYFNQRARAAASSLPRNIQASRKSTSGRTGCRASSPTAARCARGSCRRNSCVGRGAYAPVTSI